MTSGAQTTKKEKIWRVLAWITMNEESEMGNEVITSNKELLVEADSSEAAKLKFIDYLIKKRAIYATDIEVSEAEIIR